MPGIFGVIDLAARGTAARSHELVDVARRMSVSMSYEPFHRATVVPCLSLGACVGRVMLDTGKPESGRPNGWPVVLTAGEVVPEVPAGPLAGMDVVQRIAGRCAAFVGDVQTGHSHLFNDRYGRERLFVHVDGSRVFFASEAKAILAVAPRTRVLDALGLAELMAAGCTLGSRSLFRDIEILEPGTLLTFGETIERRRFFTVDRLEELAPVTSSEFLEGFGGSLRAAVDRSVRESSSIGVSLTGGLDSRMIMASLEAREGSIPCYTFGSMYRTSGDVAVARKVADACGQPHQVIEVGGSFLARIHETLDQAVYASDGYLGLSGAAELYANRQGRTIAATRMTGNWGGELMRGVRAFKFVLPKGGFVSAALESDMRDSAAQAFSHASANSLSAALFNQMPLQGYGRYAIERSQLLTSSPFLADEAVEWLYRAPAHVRASSESAATIIRRKPGLVAFPTDVGVLGTGNPAVRKAWRKAVIKAEYLTSHGAPDWMAKLASRLPASLLETRFLGVDKFTHFRFWMRHDLAGFVRETLATRDAADLDAWFDMRRVQAMVEDHIAGRANYTSEIDKVLTVAVAQKTLLADRRWASLPVHDTAEVAH